LIQTLKLMVQNITFIPMDLKIYTTIDYRLQTYAENAVKEQMIKLQKEFDNHWKGKRTLEEKPDAGTTRNF